MKELVVISGKGGTGKTSIVAAFAALAGKLVLADCDVDAADLHLIMLPEVIEERDFYGGCIARIDGSKCSECGLCFDQCRFDSIKVSNVTPEIGASRYSVDPLSCEGCGVCSYFCPEKAIEMQQSLSGKWFNSKIRFGMMAHAKLGIAAENSGKLATMVKTNARELASAEGIDLIIVDGPPGIGCPVIASVTGADLVLIVTEPTLSGKHDMMRVSELASHFQIPVAVCINKWDLNPDISGEIEQYAESHGIKVQGKIDYDRQMTKAQIQAKSIIEYGNSKSSEQIKALWEKVKQQIMQS